MIDTKQLESTINTLKAMKSHAELIEAIQSALIMLNRVENGHETRINMAIGCLESAIKKETHNETHT